jgi:F-type H+-transporting ATPase subunit epsilon
MHLSINSPDQQLFEGNVQKLTLPGSSGLFQVLKDHAPLVTTLQQGKILYQVDTKEHTLALEKGLVEINSNQVTILVETNLI